MADSLGKTCIFCGKTAKEKTKEHILPRWLIKLTGDPKREIHFFSFRPHDDPGRYRKMAFDSLHFPACATCNNNFAKLEHQAKAVMEKILAKTAIAESEWVLLLDWLDKVRIGIWLGSRYMDGNSPEVRPKFHIADRIGTKDRSVIILRASSGLRLSVFGTNSLAFRYMPSCWGLVVNDMVLVNVSHELLLARRLGFPYADDVQLHESGLSSYIPKEGRERIMRPPLTLPIASFGVAIHQCIYKDWEGSTKRELWESDYVTSHTIDAARGLSALFIEESQGRVARYPQFDTTQWLPGYTFKTTGEAAQHSAKLCFDLHAKLLDFMTIGVANGEPMRRAKRDSSMMRKELTRMRNAVSTMR
jgi:hypothetical protein